MHALWVCGSGSGSLVPPVCGASFVQPQAAAESPHHPGSERVSCSPWLLLEECADLIRENALTLELCVAIESEVCLPLQRQPRLRYAKLPVTPWNPCLACASTHLITRASL